MKKADKDALKSAFNIPEPQQKNDFVASYREKLKKNNRTAVLPAILRYGAVAAMAAVAIGIWSASELSRKPQYDYSGGSVVSETTTDTEETSATTDTSHKTEASAQSTETTTAQTTTATSSASSESMETTTAVTSVSAESTETTTAQTAPVTVGTETTTTTSVTTATNGTSQTTTLTTPRITTASTTVSTSVTITVTTTTTTEIEPPGSFYNDLTVTPSVTYEKTEDAFDLRDLNSGGGNPPTGDNPEKVVQMAQMSEYIISASVDEIIYTDIDGAPYTQENLTVYSSYKGGLGFMDKISLYLPGGYLPAEKYIEFIGYDLLLPDNCTTIYDYGGNNGEQNVGDVFLFFINTSGEAFPEGSFVLTETTDISVFELDNGYYRSLGDSSLFFASDMLRVLCKSL